MPNHFALHEHELWLFSKENPIPYCKSFAALATNIQEGKWSKARMGSDHCVADILQTHTRSLRKFWFRGERGHQKEHELSFRCSQLQYDTGFAMTHASWLTKQRSACSSSGTFCSCNLIKFLPYTQHRLITAEDNEETELCVKKYTEKTLIASLHYWEVPDQVS